MSEEFKNVIIPCKDCLVLAACQDVKIIKETLNTTFPHMLVMEKWDTNKKCYKKGIMECWANLGWDIFSSIRTYEFAGMKSSAPVLLNLFVELTALMQWIVNSTSWERGETFDFDISEIKKRIQTAKGWVK
jgi:hypothetical protein